MGETRPLSTRSTTTRLVRATFKELSGLEVYDNDRVMNAPLRLVQGLAVATELLQYMQLIRSIPFADTTYVRPVIHMSPAQLRST